MPNATVDDLRRAGSVLLLRAQCPKYEINPETGELGDGPMEETTMQVPMSVLRAWMKETT